MAEVLRRRWCPVERQLCAPNRDGRESSTDGDIRPRKNPSGLHRRQAGKPEHQQQINYSERTHPAQRYHHRGNGSRPRTDLPRTQETLVTEMTHYPDLSPYQYSESPHPMLNVGWLEREHGYPTGPAPEGLVEELTDRARGAVNVYRGIHFCRLCPDFSTARQNTSRGGVFLGSGEIRVTGPGATYASPAMIVHYVEAHSYLPPQEYCDAVLATPEEQTETPPR
jgi:hypothetical protein